MSPPSEVTQQMKSSTARGYFAEIHLVLRRCAVGFFAAPKLVESSWPSKRRGTASIRLPHWLFGSPRPPSRLCLCLDFFRRQKKKLLENSRPEKKRQTSTSSTHFLLPRRVAFSSFILPTRATLSSSSFFSSLFLFLLILRPCPYTSFIFNI